MDDEDYADQTAQHEALQQLDAWRRRAEAAVIARHNGRRIIGGPRYFAAMTGHGAEPD